MSENEYMRIKHKLECLEDDLHMSISRFDYGHSEADSDCVIDEFEEAVDTVRLIIEFIDKRMLKMQIEDAFMNKIDVSDKQMELGIWNIK